ncbi:non-ribosomal peptide synthetase, partial [Streptomyces nanshensis]|uniref:non-ribosomal peptide synthetase n=1 Tax=Streptomyces nanshensis TaxID=518642 RepID=UPI00085C25DD
AARLGKRVRVLDILLTEDLAALQAAVTRAPAVATAPGADPDGDPPLRAPHPGEPVPATYGQRGLWFHESLHPGSAVYNEPLVLRLRGPLDVTALSRAVDAVVARHEALRTGLVMEGGELRQEIRPFTPHGLTVRALRAVPAGERAAEEERAVREAVRRPFDLVHGPQVRAELLRCAAREHLLVLSMHHSVFDGGSADTLFEELAALYTAFEAESGAADGLNGADDVTGVDGAPQTAVEKAAGLGPPQSQYADFAIRQHALVEEDRLAEDLAYWRGRLDGLPETLDLPTDFPRPELPSGEGALVRARLSPELTERVDKLAHDAGATRYTAFLAALHTLLARYCGTEDLAVGAPFSGRDHPRTERSVGYYLNTLPLRADLGGAPGFRDLLARTRRTVTDAYTHQRLPYGLLLERTGRMSSAENPYLQVCLVPEDVYRHEMTFAGIESSFEYVDTGIAKFDLTVNLIPDAEGGLRLTVEYSTDLFRASTVERMVGHFRTLLESAVAEPDVPVTRLRMLTGAERTRVLSTFADGETVHAPPTAVHELVARQAESTPDAPALTDDAGVHLTYRELTERADRLAHYLAERGVDPGTMAGVRLPRGADAVIAFLAVLKTGAAYVPLDPAYPEHRLAFMAEDAGLAIELTPEVLHDDHDAIAGSPARAPAVAISGDDAAYVIYTSGSTGQPKGVQVPHRAVADLVLGMPSWTGTGPGSRLLLVSSLSFDLVTFDIWGALANGAQLVLAPAEGLTSGRLGSYIAGHGITHGNMPTALFHRQVEESPGSLAGLRTLVVGGEALDPGLAATALEANPGMRLINGYGPAEATTYSTYHTMTGPDEVTDPLPIGIPTPNTRVRVLDGNRQAVPVGVTGELHLGGPGLATGYLHRPELTAERFVPDPYGAPGELLYATGDLARWREDGTIDYAGRADGQFKLYGYRVEPGEIEAALRTHPDVASVLVMRREDRPGSPYLAAYYTTAPGSTVTARELRDVASARLPGYMVPGVFTALERFPVTAGGKTDRAALPVPAAVREESVREEAVRGEEPEREETVREAGAAPAEKGTSVLEQVAAIWREVVPVDELDPDERLFDIGGASLHVTAIHERVSERFGLSRLRAVDLFSHPTLRGYAALVERLYTEERGERR